MNRGLFCAAQSPSEQEHRVGRRGGGGVGSYYDSFNTVEVLGGFLSNWFPDLHRHLLIGWHS